MSPLRPLFVTQLYQASLAENRGFAAFNGELEQACEMLAAEDAAGRAWCKSNGYAGYTSYASLDDLPTRASAFGALKTRLDRPAAAFAKGQHLEPGGAHSGHIHPHSVLSGTVYVRVPLGASALKLEDPRLPLMMAAPPRTADAPETAKSFVYLEPEAGTILMWESWLRHEVPANRAKQARISISFNYGWR
jgi:hypothetical protein